MFPSKINSFHKFAKGLSAFGKYNTSENASELRSHTIEELSGFLNSIENEYNHLLFHISELLHISGNTDKLDEYIFKAIVENIHNNSFKSYVNGFAFLLVNSSGDYRHRWNTLKGRIYQLFEQTNLVLQRITEFEEAIALAENGKNSNCITPPYRHTTHLSKIRSFHEFVNRLVKYCKKGHSEDTNNLVAGFITELSNSLDGLKAESSKVLYYISDLLHISGDFEKLDEYILKAILENICADTEESFKKNITGFVVLLITSSEDYINRFSVIKECLNRTLGNSRFVMQRVGELEKFIPKPKKTKSPGINGKIYIATNEVRRILAESEQIINAVPLDLGSLSQKIASLCSSLDTIGNLATEFQIKEIHIPYNDLDKKLLKALLEITKTKPSYTKDIIRMLLKINDRFLKYFSPEDTNLLRNLFDRIEYLRLHEGLWSEYNFKVTVKQAYESGEKIYNNLESYKLDQNRREATLGMIGRICRSMVEFKVCMPDERIDLLLKSNDILQNTMVRNGELIPKYFGSNYLRIGLNYMDLKQWKDAIACFMKIKDIDKEKGVKKETAFEARDKIGDCYLKLGIEEKYQPTSGSTQYFILAEKFYNEAGRLPKLHPDDGKHLIGKQAGLYYCSNQHGKALPLYENILQNESPLQPQDKNLYDCLSYRKGVCLFFMKEIDKAIEQFKHTLNRHPEKEHKIKSYLWLLKLYSIQHEWNKYEETKRILFSDKELETIVNDKKLDVLLTDKMEDYIKEINDRLKSGNHWSVIDELNNMRSLQKLIEGPNHEDAVLLTKLAEAYIAIGESDQALDIFYRVKDLDNAPKNAAIALAGIGKVYMEKGEYQRAIGAFRKSFEYGQDVRMLFSQAAAHCHLKEYDKAIQIYNEILNSDKDKMPCITKTGIAKTLWSKYHEEGREDDARKAVDYIASVIEEYPDDQKVYSVFVSMSNKPIALDRIVYLIKEGKNIAITRNLLEQLAYHNVFSNEVISACLMSLSLRDTTVSGYWEYALVSVDYLMKATIYFYFFKDKDSFNKTVSNIINCILNLGNSRDILREYLCASKGAYADFFEEAYSKEVKRILSPLSTEHIDIHETLNDKVLPNIMRFIQSGIPEELFALYNNYKGKEPVGIDIKSELLKQFRGNDDLEREGKCILNYASDIAPSIKVPYVSWFLFGKLVDLFYPYPDGLWNEILSLVNKWTIEIKPVVNNNINIQFSAKLIVDKLSEAFKQAFEKIQREHNSCHIPQISWFEYDLSEEFIEGEKYECKLLLTIKMPQCPPINTCFQSLIPFLDHMLSSFAGGLFGTFKRDEYRQKAIEFFPDNINSIKVEQWIDLVHTYLDWHFSLLFNKAIHDDNYRKTIHDCIKGPLQQIQLNTNDEIINYLANVERLPVELGRIRRRSLEAITGITDVRQLNLGEIIKHLVDSLESPNSDVVFDLNISPCQLIPGYESLLKRVFSNLLNNAIAAVKPLKTISKNISIFIYEDNNDINVLIKNPIVVGEDFPSIQFSTGIGLKSARYIIEEEHCGKITVDKNVEQKVYIVKVSFPKSVRK